MAWTWIKKPINLGITIGAAVLLVVVVGLLIWGISTHKEEVALSTCWENGRAIFVEGQEQDCPEGQRVKIQWDRNKIPLKVLVVDSNLNPLSRESEEYREVESAIEEINSQFRFTLLQISSEENDIEVLWGVAYTNNESNPAGYCEFRGENGLVVSATVGIRDTSSIRLTRKILLHELGHAIGLGHDDFTGSIMFPITEDDTMEDMRLDRFTDDDVEYIRERYDRGH